MHSKNKNPIQTIWGKMIGKGEGTSPFGRAKSTGDSFFTALKRPCEKKRKALLIPLFENSIFQMDSGLDVC